MNFNFFFVQIKNIIDQSIIINRNERLSTFNEYKKNECYLINFEIRHLTIESWIKNFLKLNVIVLIVFENAMIDITKTVLSITITSLFVFVSTLLFVSFVFDMKIILKQFNLHQKYVIFFDITIYEIDFTIKIITIVVENFFNFW